MNQEILTVEIVSQRLKEVVSPDYVWPEMPTGWQLEFIVYPDGEVNMDFLHPVSCVFWSEDNDFLETPYTQDKRPITRGLLDECGVSYMTTFGHATVSDKPKESHLKSV
ncbi:hypothetical protein ACPF3S_003168 [Vibrio cholerae]|nr:hypothetical protein [Vibrio cholerae]HCT5077572.1 hypothetical protein [Vibrio cholerae]